MPKLDREAVFYNALNILAQSDYLKLLKIKNQFSSWEKAWLGISSAAGNGIDPEKEWQKLEKRRVRLILLEDDDYPPLLKEIPWPALGIYVLGELPESSVPTLAIVGTRKASEQGRELARNFSFEMTKAGFAIASGLALGIDAASHQGCLEAGGKTAAVLGNGLDYFYPRTNEKLADKILASGGAIISEHPLGTPGLPYHFLRRNRLISGLSRGVLVIEAPLKSGSLVTANFALEQNREVFVVPGPANHPNFKGSHQLIRSGGRLVSSAGEILEDLGLAEKSGEQFAPATAEEKIILEALKNFSQPLDVDKIIEITNLEAPIVNQSLTMLLIKNLIKEDGQGYGVNS